MANQLTCFGTGRTEAHAVNHIIQTTFQKLQQDFACCALGSGRFLVVTTELLFQHTIGTTNFLLLAQLNTVVRQPCRATPACTSSLARSLLSFTLGFQRADTALQEQISAFSTGKLALGTDVSCHLALTPVTRDAF